MATTENVVNASSENSNSGEADRMVTVNELVQVRIEGDADPSGYYSRVQDVVDGKLIIAWPTHNGIRMPVHRDQVLELSFVRDTVAYSFSSLVDDTSFEPLPQMRIIPCGPVSTIQRRQSFRVKCMVPVEIVGTISNEGGDLNGGSNRIISIKTTTYDLSAGGLSLRHSTGVPENCLVEARFSLPDRGRLIKAPCRVIYSEELSTRKDLFHIGLCFLAISESDRARVFRHLFSLQLKGLHS